MMSYLWVLFLVLAVITAVCTGRTQELSVAVTSGAQDAVTLCLSIVGLMGLWSGVMELMEEAGICRWISRLLQPVLRPLFRRASRDPEAIGAVASNITANFMGLSNAATPIGLRAADRMYALYGGQGAPDEILTFIVLNTTSIQLIPTTVAAVRASLGASQPFDIMPAVWGASVVSVAAGLCTAKLCAALCRGKRP